MKNLLGKIYILFALMTAFAIQIHVVIAANKKSENVVFPKNITESTTIESKHLTTIANNALLLVCQIQQNKHDETERTKALKNIDYALKKLPSDVQKSIEPHITAIQKESDAFSSHRRPLEKYSSSTAEKSLETLTINIQKLAENKSEAVVTEAQQKLVAVIAKTESIIKEAVITIDKTREKLAKEIITPIKAAKIIGEQNYMIGAAERMLKKETQQAEIYVTQNDIQTNRLSQFAAKIYGLSSHALAPLKSGYGYTEEEKELAYAIITQLEQQLEQENNRLSAQLKNPNLTNAQRAHIKHAFELTAQQIYNEIYHQKIITGQVMSTNRKLFWGTVAVAGAITAGLIGYNYFSSPAEIMPLAIPENSAPIKSTSQELPKKEHLKETLEQEEQEAITTKQTIEETPEVPIEINEPELVFDNETPPSAGSATVAISTEEQEELSAEQAATEEQEELSAKQAATEEQEELSAKQAATEEQEKLSAEQAATEEQEELSAEQAATEEQEELSAEQAATEEQEELSAEQAATEEQEELSAEQAATEEQEELSAEQAATEEQEELSAEQAATEEQEELSAKQAATEEQEKLSAEQAATEEQEKLSAEQAATEEAQHKAEDKQTEEKFKNQAAQKIEPTKEEISSLSSDEKAFSNEEPTDVNQGKSQK